MHCIGLTGRFAAGKSTVASLFASQVAGRAFNLADEVREEAAKRGLAPTVENLRSLANKFREDKGPGFWAERVLSKAIGSGVEWIVVDSIRSPSEVGVLKSFFGKNFFLIAVSAPAEVRFERFKQTARGKEFSSIKDFLAAEEKQLKGDEKSQAILDAVVMADEVVENNGTLDGLKGKVALITSMLAKRR